MAMSVLFTSTVIVGLLNRWKVVRLSAVWFDNLFGGLFISVALAFIGATLGSIALFRKGSTKTLPLLSTIASGFVLLLFGGLLLWANNRDARITEISIVEYGRYERSVDTLQTPDLVCVESTDTIQAIPGGRFGIGYVCKGEPNGARASLRLVWVFPPPGAWDSTRGEFKTMVTRNSTTRIGQMDYYWYRFDYNWELIAGIWTCQVWSDEKHHAEKKFLVVRR